MLKFALISIPFLFAIGTVFHFIYKWSNNSRIVGLIAPVNESIFEHSKLLLFPLILVYTIYYFYNSNNLYENSYFLAMLVSVVVSIVTMFSFYYTYKGIIGNSYLWIDILDLLISIIVGQLVANHVYVYSDGINKYISISLIVFISLLYFYLTCKPIKIPLFFDNITKSYGINKKL